MEWKIGNVTIKNQVVLAPMANISTPSYMKICEEFKVGYAISELISSEAIVRNNQKTLKMLNKIDELKIPVAIQIFGSNPTTMAKSAKILVDLYHVKVIDINMGCPVPKVAISAKAGSALLKDPDKVYEIVKAVVEEVNVPVTVKIRSGWDQNSINAVQIAQVIEKAGAKAICVHPRTRSEGYSGKANWQIIKEVKQSVKIPVIGNGDITTPKKAKQMLDETGCDAIMIGRGALGNPWLIKECVKYLEDQTIIPPPTYKEKIAMMKYHFNLLKNDKSLQAALLEIRSTILYYLKGLPNSKELKQAICTCHNEEEILKCLDNYELWLNQELRQNMSN